MKSIKIWHLMTAMVIVASAVGCSGGSSSDMGSSTPGASADNKPAAGGASDKPVEIAFITNNTSAYWTIARKGVEKGEGESKNVKVDFEMPAGGTAAEQKTIINDMISKGVQGIAMSPVDPTNEIPLINETAKKITVFTQDSDAPTSDRACYIGSNNHDAGKLAGEELKKALPNGGKVMVFVGDKDAQNAKDRYDGLQEAIKGTKITIVDVRTDGTDRGKAVSNVSDALVKEPDLAGLVGLWSYNGPAILKAVQSADKVGKVKIVCFDSEDDTVAGLKKGAIFATIVQQPFEFGEKSVLTLAAFLRGDKSVIPANKQIIIPTQAIEKEQIDKFAADQAELTK